MSAIEYSPMLMSSYRSLVSRLPGTTAWNTLYVSENSTRVDVTNDGENSCAYMVSGVLVMFGLSGKTHATIHSTINDMRESGWHETHKPLEGAVVEWDGHIGFYMNDNEAISVSSLTKSVARHSLILNDGREPTRYWSHIAIESDDYKAAKLEHDPVLPKLDNGTYRHNKSGHLYEVIAVTFNVETNEPLVLYKPLYEAGYELFARPYDMFVKHVELNGVVVPRFEKVTD